MNNRPYFIINVEAAIKNNGRYLLVLRSQKEEHSPGTLSLPGGKADQETVSPDALEQALRREINEEIGLSLNNVTYLESKTFLMDTGEWCLSVCFYCDDFTGEVGTKSKDEIDEIVWAKPDQLDKLANCPPWTKQGIVRAENLLQQHRP